jgi:signal peptidase I
MTGPGTPPRRGRHAAPDDDARQDDEGPQDDPRPGGRHAASDPPGWNAAPEHAGRPEHAGPLEHGGPPEPLPRRRHAAPDHAAPDYAATDHAAPASAAPASAAPDSAAPDYAAPASAASGVAYHRPSLGNGIGYRRPDAGWTGYPPPGADRSGYGGREGSPNGLGTPGGPYPVEPSRHGYPAAGGTGLHRADPGLDAYPPPGGRYPLEPTRQGYPTPGGTGLHRAEPGLDAYPNGARQGGSDPGTSAFWYHRPEPGAHRHGGAQAAPWPGTDGYRLESPAPPAANGYRLDEPVAPVTGFPYTVPPPTPTAYRVNGHGVDAAERDAAAWPANGNATVWPVDARRAELDRALDPQIVAVPLEDEATEVLDRPSPRPGGTPPKPPHPPRAVVRRRRARRKALEWPFLIVFAVVSAFLIRQYVVQTFFIPSASMHETLVEGDRVLVNKVGYHLHDVHRGDVVVFGKPPNLDVSEDDLIKRVIALPGETVQGRGGKVYVNGAPLTEPYVEPRCHGTGEFPAVTVPAGKLWVMGDNRCNSSDSRVFGPIDEKLVVGRAFVLAWPLGRLAWL